MTLEEMGRQPLPDAVQEHYEEYLRGSNRGDSVEVNPRNARLHGRRYDGTSVVLKEK